MPCGYESVDVRLINPRKLPQSRLYAILAPIAPRFLLLGIFRGNQAAWAGEWLRIFIAAGFRAWRFSILKRNAGPMGTCDNAAPDDIRAAFDAPNRAVAATAIRSLDRYTTKLGLVEGCARRGVEKELPGVTLVVEFEQIVQRSGDGIEG
jgi:hypothetical protein